MATAPHSAGHDDDAPVCSWFAALICFLRAGAHALRPSGYLRSLLRTDMRLVFKGIQRDQPI